jgi:hypothetical protein
MNTVNVDEPQQANCVSFFACYLVAIMMTAYVLVCANIYRYAGSLGKVTTSVIMTSHFGSHLDYLDFYLKLYYDYKHMYIHI